MDDQAFTIRAYDGKFYMYKRLHLLSDRTCEEREIAVTDTSEFKNLFPFCSRRILHVFCFCVDDISIDKVENSSIYHYINELWQSEMRKRSEEIPTRGNRIFDTNCEGNIEICNGIEEFVDNLGFDMVNKKCISRKELTDLKKFLINPYNEGEEHFFRELETEVVLLYFISQDVYDTLKQSYNLPRRSSTVAKLDRGKIIPMKSSRNRDEERNSGDIERNLNYKEDLIAILRDMVKRGEEFNKNDSVFEQIKSILQNESGYQYKSKNNIPPKIEK